jgi:hypothetical protein
VKRPVPPLERIEALAGYRFPGGRYRVEHWENVLLRGCTGLDAPANGQVHPVALFHVPILGCGTSIAEMFALGEAESDLSILIESYDWEIFAPLREGIEYDIDGMITAADRRRNEAGKLYDRIQFRFEVRAEDRLCARSTITWHYTRNTL